MIADVGTGSFMGILLLILVILLIIWVVRRI